MIIGINASYLAAKNRTGVENYATLLILSLLAHDKVNTYRLFSPKYIDKKSLPKSSRWSLHISPFPKGWHRFRLPLSLLRHKVDIFFDPGYTVPPYINIPSVVPIMDLAHKYFPDAYTPSQIKDLERTFRLAQKKAGGIIFTSENTQKDFNKFYPGSKGLQKVLYMGYDQDNFTRNISKDILHLSDPYILYVGRLEKKKNIINLINAYIALRHKHTAIRHHLVLCGMPGNGHEEIEKTIKQNQKFGRDIIMTGYMPSKDLPGLYAHADLFVFPSLYEGFGIPLLEAMAAKIPIAASETSSIPEVTGEAAFYFDPKNTDNMASTLVNALTDSVGRAKRISIGNKRLKEFSWEHYASEFIDFLNQVDNENCHRP